MPVYVIFKIQICDEIYAIFFCYGYAHMWEDLYCKLTTERVIMSIPLRLIIRHLSIGGEFFLPKLFISECIK